MKIDWLSSALMTFILFAFMSGANGAEAVALNSQQGGTLANFDNSAPFNEYYGSIMGSVPTSLLTVPTQVDITSNAPAYVYLGTAMQKVDYSAYQPAAVSNSLWIAGATSWSQYAIVPQGSLVNLLAISTKEGQGTFVVYHPNGQRYDFNCLLFPTSQLQLYADAPGSYQISFIMDGAASNTVMIDASSTTPTIVETGYLAGEAGGDYLASIFGVPKTSMGPQAGLDNKAALKEYQKKINSEYWSSSDNDIAWAIGIDRWLNAA
jgi:hypothetical protein